MFYFLFIGFMNIVCKTNQFLSNIKPIPHFHISGQ